MTSEVGLAVSEHGSLAVVKRSEGRIELFRSSRVVDNSSQQNQTITEDLISPYDICFAPNNHLVVTDIGDKTFKVFNFEGSPELVSKFSCLMRIRDGHTFIENCENLLSPSGHLVLVPQNIVAGPTTSSQLFVVYGNLIFVITMDWNTVEILDFQQLSSSQDWARVQRNTRTECDKVSLVHDHSENHKLGGRNPLAITKAQFCAMFYHVTQTRRGNINYKCLESSQCRVGKMSRQADPRFDYAASVVIYVRLTDRTGRLIFHARYGNCSESERRNTIHAEYFMLMDEEFKEAVLLLQDQRGGSITMFMNKQPCYKSTKHHDRMPGLTKKQCAQDLVEFYNLHCSSYGVSFTIYLCQLYKVDLAPTPQFEEDITNGLEGMRKMITTGIELKAMTKESWQQLAGYACMILPLYQGGERQKLDQHIREFLVACEGHRTAGAGQNQTEKGEIDTKGHLQAKIE